MASAKKDYQSTTIKVDPGHPNGDMPVLVFEAKGKGPHPCMLVMQHLPVAHAGLETDPFQIDVGRRYAEAGFTVVMPFMFHWWPTELGIDKKREAFRDDWTVEDIKATFAWAQKEKSIDTTHTGIVGHCWGGRIAWLGACHLPELKACGVFYGGRINVQFADKAPAPITLAKQISCPVLGIFGNEDQAPSPKDVNEYAKALSDANQHHEFYRYDSAGHGFQDFTNDEKYRKTQAEHAWGEAISFFKRHLK